MKKILIIGLVVVLIFVTGYYFYNNTKPSESSIIMTSSCSGVGMFGFVIEKQNDGNIHFRIPSKPPQTDVIVTQTKTTDGYEYKGDHILVTEKVNNLQVNINGQVLQNCVKN